MKNMKSSAHLRVELFVYTDEALKGTPPNI